ncbi:MAG: response regulator [Methanobacteriota archaeon]
MARRTIVVADDSADLLEVTVLLLETLGHRAIGIRESKDILPTIRAERPDLLLQDVMMPGLDLPALVAMIRSLPETAGLPIVLFTASVEGDEVCREVGADGVLTKPFGLDELVAAIDEHTRPHVAQPV